MKNKHLTILDAGIAFVVAFILAQFIGAIGVSLTESILDAMGKTATQIEAFWNTALGYLFNAIFMNIAFVLVFVYYYRRMKKSDVFTRPNQNTLKYFGICIIIGISTLYLLSGVLNYFQLLVDKLDLGSGSLMYELNSPKTYLISLVSLALIPAICEELIFRGVLVNCLKQKGEIFAIVLSSIMFSIFHFSLYQLIYPICFGLILAIVYLRTKNIIFPILLHFINNALSLSIQYFSNSDSSTVFTHSATMLMLAIITFAIWILIMRWLFKDFRAYKQKNTDIDNQKLDQQSTSTQSNISPQQVRNEKFDKWVLYGSIAIMLCIYLLITFM